MKVFTIGFTQKSASEFFNKIKSNKIELVIDIRLNNVSQLAGFAKGKDLEYFLKELCGCDYIHDKVFAPTKELLDGYRSKKVTWDEYEQIFGKIMEERKIADHFKKLYSKMDSICLLCTEPTPEKCHRRLIAEYLKGFDNNIEVIHIK